MHSHAVPATAPSSEAGRAAGSPASIILDTDLGFDCDDAGAVAVLHALADRAEARILAMGCCSPSEWAAPCLASLNAWFGRPEIPVGTLKGAGKEYDLNYPSVGAGYSREIATRWPSTLKTGEEAPDAVAVYRRALAAQPDGSVTVVTTGNARNLHKLLESAADAASPLSGADLVKRKAASWVCAGGAYPSGDEYCFVTDGKAAHSAVTNWPTPVVFSGWEIGIAIRTGGRLFTSASGSPLCVAWERDAGHGNSACSWALAAVLCAVRGPDDCWSQVRGTCQVENNGHNGWQHSENGRHAYLVRKAPEAEVARVLDDLLIRAHRRKAGASAARKRPGRRPIARSVARRRQEQGPARQAEPGGQVFREYSWDAGEGFHVLALKEDPFTIPAELDLEHAVRAEVTLEISSEHMGFEGLGIRLNGSRWYPFSYPELSPRLPSPSLWYQHWYPTVPIELQDLKRGTGNTFELKAGHRGFDLGSVINCAVVVHTPWFPVYGVTVRVFYDPARTGHPVGRVLAPAADSEVGLSVELKAEAHGANAAVPQVDFVGWYEDVNYEGDGLYRRWHGHPFHGRITHHLGSTARPDSTVSWDTSWVPDQPGPMAVAARITDATGMIYLTRPARGIRLVRPGLSVELCKPFDVPRSFTAAQYGAWVVPDARTQQFRVRGDLAKAVDARYVLASWGDLAACRGYAINGVALEDKPAGENWRYNLSAPPIRPLSVLRAGENTFSTIPGPGRLADVYLPGAQVLVRYRTG